MRIIRVALNDRRLNLFNNAKVKLYEQFLKEANGAQIADLECSPTEFHVCVSHARDATKIARTVQETMKRFQVTCRVNIR